MKYEWHGAARWRRTQPCFPDSPRSSSALERFLRPACTSGAATSACSSGFTVGLFSGRTGSFPTPTSSGAAHLVEMANGFDRFPGSRAASGRLGILACALALSGSVALNAWAQTGSGVIYPPWQGGANNPALEKGLEFTVAEIDNLPDFHGNLNESEARDVLRRQLVLSLAPLVAKFEASYPQYRGRIYFETLPPGLLVRQLRNGGTGHGRQHDLERSSRMSSLPAWAKSRNWSIPVPSSALQWRM